MYRKKSRGWYKHKDFILIDLACLFMALILAYLIRNGSVRNLFKLGIYRNVMIFVILVDLFLIILFESYKGVLRRGRYQELRSVIRQMILIELASGLYLFTVSGGHTFSRIILYLMGIFYVLLSYCTRIIWKKRLLHKMAEGGEHSLYIVSNYDLASKVIQNVKEHNYNRYNINGLILIDKDMTGKEIAGVPVVADLNNASSFICQQWVDEVFVNVDETYPYPQELIEELLEMGMPVHVNLAKVRSTPGQKQFVEAIGGYTVLTTTMNYATDRQALAKRVLDILGGLVGCFLTGIIFVFIAPAIYISSPGPIFFSQTRIGKNGKPFKMYKFRSMYMDAEERRAELMAQNKMSDGRMFKIDFDPRVIGNKILPDGTRKTGIGEFIRKTSLDEFPQFWNVLNGTMSLVGTRPILQDELQKYELHHRARIAIKPGITGMWQAEIVRYIFERYVCGVSATAIAKELNAMGKKTVRGSIWRADAVLFILRNEKYVGDCESQKTVTKNFLTHEVSINEGDAPKYYVTDHHVAIIDRHTWNQAQMMLLGGEEARDKKEKKRRANNASPFTNLTYGVDGCNEPMFRIGYNTPLYTYTDERSAKAEP